MGYCRCSARSSEYPHTYEFDGELRTDVNPLGELVTALEKMKRYLQIDVKLIRHQYEDLEKVKRVKAIMTDMMNIKQTLGERIHVAGLDGSARGQPPRAAGRY